METFPVAPEAWQSDDETQSKGDKVLQWLALSAFPCFVIFFSEYALGNLHPKFDEDGLMKFSRNHESEKKVKTLAQGGKYLR